MFMDIEFDEQPSDLAATSVRAGAKFRPKARPRLRKHVSVSTSRTISNDEDIHAQTKSIQPEEEGGRLDLESVRIVEEVTSAYGHHTEKFQPKPRFHNNVIQGQNYGVNEEPSEPHYFADDISHISTDSSGPTVNEEPRNESFNTNVDSYATQQEEKFPQVPQGTVPEMATGNPPRGWEHEEREEDSCFGNTVEEQTGRERNMRKLKRVTSEESRAAQKRQKTSEEPNQCSKKPQKKKNFKHSTPRLKRTLEKELLEIPDDEIRFLPIRDLLRLVDYKEWLEKKEANRGKGSQSQESTSKASDNQYSQDDTENFESDEYRENQESSRVKPDSPVNYQTYSHKTARSHWSKQDTELFYEGIQEFGSNFSMVQQLFPNRSRQQLKLKYKLEERKHPLKLNDALTSRSKHHIHYQNVIKKFQQEAAARKAEQEEEEDEAETAGEGATEAEAETNDVPENAKYEETEKAGDAQVEDENSLRLDEAEAEYDQLSNDDYDDEAECDYWASYKSDL